jgi:hypothetical protein
VAQLLFVKAILVAGILIIFKVPHLVVLLVTSILFYRKIELVETFIEALSYSYLRVACLGLVGGKGVALMSF